MSALKFIYIMILETTGLGESKNLTLVEAASSKQDGCRGELITGDLIKGMFINSLCSSDLLPVQFLSHQCLHVGMYQ